MKNPGELAEEYCIEARGFFNKQDYSGFLAGWEAAQKRIENLVKEELELLQANSSFSKIIQRPCVESAILNILEKIGDV